MNNIKITLLVIFVLLILGTIGTYNKEVYCGEYYCDRLEIGAKK